VLPLVAHLAVQELSEMVAVEGRQAILLQVAQVEMVPCLAVAVAVVLLVLTALTPAKAETVAPVSFAFGAGNHDLRNS
jgi:hypothetical protein